MAKFYDKQTQQLLDDIFECAYDPQICGYRKGEFAQRCNLSEKTIYLLRTQRTKDPRYSTILKMARSVNMDLDLAREALGLSARNALKTNS
jgi:DNA-binding XRE family transcriptional regulator